MRGLCAGSHFDRNFVLASSSDDVLFYQGDRYTNITYDRENRLWAIISNRQAGTGLSKGNEVKVSLSLRVTEDVGIIILKQPPSS